MAQDYQTMLEELELMLAEKEEIFVKREKQLQDYHQELKKLESELNQKISFLKEERARLDQEKEKIEESWKEIRAQEENAQKAAVFAERLKQKRQENLQLEQSLLKETDELLERKKHLGISSVEAPDLIEEQPEEPVSHYAEQNQKADIVPESGTQEKTDTGSEEPALEMESELIPEKEPDKIPELLRKMEAAARQIFAGGTVEELTEERLCVSVGDKEVRFFVKEPMNEAQIFTVRMGGGTDRELQQKIRKANQIQQDWLFICKENHLTCTMPFTSQTNPEVVVEKCAECMTNYFM